MIQKDNYSYGVHLCGSMVLPDNSQTDPDEPKAVENVLRGINSALAQRVRRYPDGEGGRRSYFVIWQVMVYMQCPWVLNDVAASLLNINVTEAERAAAEYKKLVLGDLLYDKHAIDSYQIFARLKQEGVIEPDARFLVGLPTPINAVHPLVRHEYQARIEPLYREKMIEAVKNIQQYIPASELAIQWDCPIEMATLESVPGPMNTLPPVCEPTIEAVVDRINLVAKHVHGDVEMGFHICYGDAGRVHFVQPKNTELMVSLANALSTKLEHTIKWIHMPVPKDRIDDAYFVPLADLKLASDTELYLGLVHAFDVDGTQQRIKTAQRYVSIFGISTECGMGRVTPEESGSILEISKACSVSYWDLSK